MIIATLRMFPLNMMVFRKKRDIKITTWNKLYAIVRELSIEGVNVFHSGSKSL